MYTLLPSFDVEQLSEEMWPAGHEAGADAKSDDDDEGEDVGEERDGGMGGPPKWFGTLEGHTTPLRAGSLQITGLSVFLF